jgi:hypothetical protein
MKSTAPSLTAATAVSRFPWPEIISTGSVESRRFISWRSCSPSSREPCSHTSSSTMDGRRSSIASSAALLSAAVRTA